jgi:hypothetical protein
VKEVKKLLNSTADTSSNNSGVVNVYKGMFNHVILPRLATTATGAYDSTKAKQWHYAAVGEWEAYFGTWEADNLKNPSVGNNGEDVHNDDWTFGSRGTWGVVVVSAKGILTSTGLAS